MINIKHLTQKCIINASVLYQLREQTAADTSDPQAYFLEKVDGLINDHLRGMDFKVRRLVRQELIQNYFSGDEHFEITYYDVASILIALDLPVNQIITNFQNWILMSTEFSLSSSEIAKLCLEEMTEKSQEFQIAYEDSIPIPLHETFDNSPNTLSETNLADDADGLAPNSDGVSDISNLIECTVPALTEEVPIKYEDCIEEVQPLTLETTRKLKLKYNYKRISVYLIGAISVIFILHLSLSNPWQKEDMGFADASSLVNVDSCRPAEMKLIVRVIASRNSEGFPTFLSYEPINIERMQGYLKRKNSLLANEPYFSAIMQSAARENIHPVLMFAITGQEQGFVKRGSENAALIVNNPFNVFTSWIEYNTDIHDSSRLAAETVKNILSERPVGENPFKWLNKTYAEDPKWSIGVERLFLEIEEYLGPYDMNLVR